MAGAPTRVLMGVNESTIKGYPHASISSRKAFEWTLDKIVRSNTSGFNLLFFHVQVPDEDGLEITLLFNFKKIGHDPQFMIVDVEPCS